MCSSGVLSTEVVVVVADLIEIEIPSGWATKVSEIGQQALLGAEGVEESQRHKGLGIHRP